jgi:1-deoxyxylulose-5-phosphate synthase
MEALHDVVKAGKARYIGASSMFAWQFAKMQYVAELHGWTKFVSMQDQYHLVQRGGEQEMFSLLADQGVSNVSMATIALAWVLKNPVVNAPIVGATKDHHLPDAVAALDITLTEDEVTALEEHYTLREPTYF